MEFGSNQVPTNATVAVGCEAETGLYSPEGHLPRMSLLFLKMREKNLNLDFLQTSLQKNAWKCTVEPLFHSVAAFVCAIYHLGLPSFFIKAVLTFLCFTGRI